MLQPIVHADLQSGGVYSCRAITVLALALAKDWQAGELSFRQDLAIGGRSFWRFCSIWFHSVSFRQVPVSWCWQGRVSSRARAELMLLSFSPLGWFVPFSSFEKQVLFLEHFVALQQIGWRKELKTAVRWYGQRLSLAAGNDLLRQQRERASSFHRILLPGGGVPGCQVSHIAVGRGSRKVAEIDFLRINCAPYLLSLSNTFFN